MQDRDPSPSILETLSALQQALHGARPGDREPLFASRDRLRELVELVSSESWSHLGSLATTVQKFVGHVLRAGDVRESDAVGLLSELVAAMSDIVSQSRPADGPLRIVHGRTSNPTGASPIPMAAGPAEHPPVSPAAPSRAPGESEVSLRYDEVEESRLGEILVQSGYVSREDLDRAVGLQQVSRQRLGDVLLSMGVLDEFHLRDALEQQRQATLRMAGGGLHGHSGGLEMRIVPPDQERSDRS